METIFERYLLSYLIFFCPQFFVDYNVGRAACWWCRIPGEIGHFSWGSDSEGKNHDPQRDLAPVLNQY
jgi:hypothetical protein